MSKWNHRGFDISLEGSRFAVDIAGARVSKGSLDAAKKAIDKHLDAEALRKAKNVSVSYPVLILEVKDAWDEKEPEYRIRSCVISALDADTLRVVFDPPAPEEERWPTICSKIMFVVPDTPANKNRLDTWLEAKHRKFKADKALDGRSVETFYGSYSGCRGVPRKSYAVALEELRQSWAAAQKGKTEE